MTESPENNRPPGRPARILAEARRRPVFTTITTLCLAWSLLAVAVECSQVLRFRLFDVWPADQPALWTPDSRHVEALVDGVSRLRGCLHERGLEDEMLAVGADPSLGYQGLYWTLWLISMLPEHETRPLGADGDPAPARLLVSSIERESLDLVCEAGGLRLYSLGEFAAGDLDLGGSDLSGGGVP